MNYFICDRLVDRGNICNLTREQERLARCVDQGERVVVYGPRNYGKTSVIRNVVIKDFRRHNKRCFVFFADLMEVRSMQALAARLAAAFERSFEESFPGKQLLKNAKRHL